MILAKTNSGFEIELDENVLGDQELIDALVGLEDGEFLNMSRVVLRLLGKDGRKKLYDHLRTPDGRVPTEAVAAAVGELLNSFAAGKNSSSSPT